MTTFDFDGMTSVVPPAKFSSIPTGRTDSDRMAEAVGIATDIRTCACGCGTKLRAEAKSNYVRGHKLSAMVGETSKDPNPPSDDYKKHPVFPGDNLPKEVKQEIEDQLQFYLGIIALGWEVRDPYCGGEFTKRVDSLVEKLIPIIARNPKLLSFFTNSSNLTMYLDLAAVAFPIGKMVFQHHVFHSIGNEPESNPTIEDYSSYPVS